MKTIRHLMTIVFLLCGLTALGSERGYDRNDLGEGGHEAQRIWAC